MKKLLIFSTMVLTVSMAHAGDGSYTGEITPQKLDNNQIEITHTQEKVTLKGRNEHDLEDIKLKDVENTHKDVDPNSVVNGIDIRGRSE
ncbi:TPA: hypothetical protein ACF37V_004693 [Vibrio parahaemolyticus]|nr:hypothetical protein [Vibrio parahaemolyticus]MDG2997167.1 hypothetical protein [Vibrio parahaemolyticus]